MICPKHGEYTTSTCLACSAEALGDSTDTGNGHPVQAMPRLAPDQALQFAAACMQVGAGFVGLMVTTGGHARLHIDEAFKRDATVQALSRQLEAGIATAQAALNASVGHIVAPF